VVALDPTDNSITEIATGLGGPGHLLGTHRFGVGCTDSFNLIIIEETADRLSLGIPSQGILISPWASAVDPVDLAILPPLFADDRNLRALQPAIGGRCRTAAGRK